MKYIEDVLELLDDVEKLWKRDAVKTARLEIERAFQMVRTGISIYRLKPAQQLAEEMKEIK